MLSSQPFPLLVLLGDYIDRGLFSLNGVLRTALQLFVTAPEHGAEHDLQFVLLTPQGEQLSNATAKIMANAPHEDRDSILTFSLDMWNLSFPSPGDYSIRILVDGSERKRLPLVVEQREAQAPGQQGGRTASQPPFPPPTGQA